MLLLGTILHACLFIDENSEVQRLDPDNDGIIWPDDCNDNNAEIGLPTQWYLDEDGDGWGSEAHQPQCLPPTERHVPKPGDCNDSNSAIYPDATEYCDGIDNDCDGLYDNDDDSVSYGPEHQYYVDNDNDGFGNPSTLVLNCQPQEGHVSIGGDCDDSDVYTFPGAATEDSNFGCMTDVDGDGYGSDSPVAGVLVGTDCNDLLVTANPFAPEVCDYNDNDCDEIIDEETNQYFLDADGDGYGDPEEYSCLLSSSYVTNDNDCDDSLASVSPNQVETCDLLDNDCNGLIDDGVQVEFYRDADGDGFGDPLNTIMSCSGDTVSGYVLNNGDCDDSRGEVCPFADEFCDGIDNNCDGQIDNDALNSSIWFIDADHDGYGDASTSIDACQQPSGYSSNYTDCDDNNSLAYPTAQEIIGSSVDENCDGIEYCYVDSDDDGYSSNNQQIIQSTDLDCTDSGEGSDSEPTTDCDDFNSAVNPGATEIVDDGLDQNCDGLELCFTDFDDDGYRTIDTSLTLTSVDLDCLDAGEGSSSEQSTDCDDTNPAINPGATDIVDDGVDQNCDGGDNCYVDEDDDGFRNMDGSLITTSGDLDCNDSGEGSTADPPTDCDDTDNTAYPGATELIADGKDQDCDTFELCYIDDDNDGYTLDGSFLISASDISCTSTGLSNFLSTTDCDDGNNLVFPDQPPVCSDGIADNDCNPQTLCFNDEITDIYNHEIAYNGQSNFGTDVSVSQGNYLSIGQTTDGNESIHYYAWADIVYANTQQDAMVSYVGYGSASVIGDWNGNGTFGGAGIDASGDIWVSDSISGNANYDSVSIITLQDTNHISTVDINNDGETEIFLLHQNGNMMSVIENPFQFTNQYVSNWSSNCLNNGIAFENNTFPISMTQSLDVNEDGFLDLTFGKPDHGSGKIFAFVLAETCLNSSPDMRFSTSGSGVDSLGSYFRMGDIDQDGYPDLAAYDETNDFFVTYLTSINGAPFEEDSVDANDALGHSLVLNTNTLTDSTVEILSNGRLVFHVPSENRTAIYSISSPATVILDADNADVNYYDYLSGGVSGHSGQIERLDDVDGSGREDILISVPNGLDAQQMGGRIFILLDP